MCYIFYHVPDIIYFIFVSCFEKIKLDVPKLFKAMVTFASGSLYVVCNLIYDTFIQSSMFSKRLSNTTYLACIHLQMKMATNVCP